MNLKITRDAILSITVSKIFFSDFARAPRPEAQPDVYPDAQYENPHPDAQCEDPHPDAPLDAALARGYCEKCLFWLAKIARIHDLDCFSLYLPMVGIRVGIFVPTIRAL